MQALRVPGSPSLTPTITNAGSRASGSVRVVPCGAVQDGHDASDPVRSRDQSTVGLGAGVTGIARGSAIAICVATSAASATTTSTPIAGTTERRRIDAILRRRSSSTGQPRRGVAVAESRRWRIRGSDSCGCG